MAYDKIIPVHARLDKCIHYVCNYEKTAPSTGVILQAAINCELETAYADMVATKHRWDKTRGVLGYHIIHSFKPGEVTPEQAQELGVEFAQRLLGEKYEAIVTTHLDHAHLHCHIVFNSVSFVDGRKYQNKFHDYFGDIRGISNEVSRENGLSVIDPKGRGQHYAEWNAEHSGKTTVRGLIRQDIDAAIADAFTLQTFFSILENRGYAVKRGPGITYTAVRPPGGARFIRLDSLGEGYAEDDIRKRIAGSRNERPAPEPPKQSPRPFLIVTAAPCRYIVRRGSIRRPHKLHGIRALYVRYLYLLGKAGKSRYKKPIPFEIRREITKLEKYKRQFCLMQKYHIDTDDQLSMLTDALQAD
ncbi:MAG: relaxase/mobilization nuclease domain-containing protein, partial [Faecousia sp.]